MNARTVADVMTRDLVTVDITDTTQEAARLMKEHATGDVVVTDSGRLAGILTDRDIAVRLVAEGRDGTTRVGELVLDNVVTCPPDAPLADAVRTMKQYDVRRLPVIEGDRAVGILSIGDLALLTDAGDLIADISSAPDSETGQG
jgi:CBS domain-containing protein